MRHKGQPHWLYGVRWKMYYKVRVFKKMYFFVLESTLLWTFLEVSPENAQMLLDMSFRNQLWNKQLERKNL
jgi:hypothetical protein